MVHLVATGVAVELRQLVDWVDECDWYIMVFVWDTVLGCAINIVLYRYTAAWAASVPILEPLSRVGDYEAKPNADGEREPSTLQQRVQRWGAQVLQWVVCAIVGRLCVFVLLVSAHVPFGHVATLVGSWGCTESTLAAKTWIFVVVIPVTMDATQFVVQNFFLKPKSEDAHEPNALTATHDFVPLINDEDGCNESGVKDATYANAGADGDEVDDNDGYIAPHRLSDSSP